MMAPTSPLFMISTSGIATRTGNSLIPGSDFIAVLIGGTGISRGSGALVALGVLLL